MKHADRCRSLTEKAMKWKYPERASTLLLKHAEKMPKWLARHTGRSRPAFKSMLCSRTFFYPGAHFDEDTVRQFAAAHAAHCFIFADYECYRPDMSFETVRENMPFLQDYELVNHRVVNADHLRPEGRKKQTEMHPQALDGFVTKVIHWMVLSLRKERQGENKPQRLCFVFMNWEGHDACDFLYHQGDSMAPYAVLISIPFGLDRSQCGRPEWLIANGFVYQQGGYTSDDCPEKCPHHWPGFELVSIPERAGMVGMRRALYRFEPDVEHYFERPFEIIQQELENPNRNTRPFFERYPAIQQDIFKRWDGDEQLHQLWARHLRSKYWLWRRSGFLHAKLESTPVTAQALLELWVERVRWRKETRMSCPAFLHGHPAIVAAASGA
jgi:hypothetical protein